MVFNHSRRHAGDDRPPASLIVHHIRTRKSQGFMQGKGNLKIETDILEQSQARIYVDDKQAREQSGYQSRCPSGMNQNQPCPD